ncbi:hypothetical protein L7F22_026196 [Adiantum nelumboides]|nr:hypothetical protein [Adiantum nelumboides]
MPPPRPKVPPYLLMLVVSFALVGLIGYQTLKDRKISGDLLLENQLLKDLLKKEKKKANYIQEKYTKLSSQQDALNGLKDGLSGQLIELKRVKSLTDEGRRKLESSLLDMENEVKDLKAKLALFDEKEEELKLMKENIKQKDAEINELKAQVKVVDKHSSGKTDSESTNTSGSAIKADEESHEKNEMMKEHSPSFGQGIAEKEKKASENDEETVDAKVEATTTEHKKDQAEMSKNKSHTHDNDLEDEESKVDDRLETVTNEDAGQEVDADKTHDEDETDEHPDIDMDVVNKADLDENEMAAME